MPAGTIALILNLTFVLTLVIGFLIGLWRGVKKASINIVFSLVGLVIAFFVCGFITNAILGINVQDSNGEPASLAQLLINMFEEDPTIGQILGANANNAEFIAKLVYAVANVIIFLLFALAIQFVCYILYAIISAIVVKKKDKDGNKLPKHRISGGIIGIVKTFVVMMFVFMPFNALLGTATDIMSVTYDNSTSAVEVEGGNQGTNQATEISYNVLEGLNTSAYGVIGNMFGLDNVMCDYLTSFKIDNETIYIRQDVANIYDVYNLFTQISNPSQTTVLSKLNFDNFDRVINNVVNSGFFNKVLIDTVGSILENYTSYTFIDWNGLGEVQNVIKDISEGLKNKTGSYSNYFTNDILKIYDAFKTVAKSGALDASADLTAMQKINNLASENYEALETAIKDVFNMNIVRDGTSSALNIVLSKLMEDMDSVAVNGREIADEEWNEMATQVALVVKNYAGISVDVDVISLLNDPLVLLAQDSTIDIVNTFDKLGQVVDDLREIKLFKNQEGVSVIDKVLTKNNFTLPSESEVIYNNDGTVATIQNYKQLMNFISPSLVDLKNINVYDLLSSSPVSVTDVMVTFANAVTNDSSPNKDVLSRIILPLSQVEPTKSMIVEELLKGLNNDLVNFNTLNTYSDWKTDLKYISNMLLALNKGSVGENQTYLRFVLANNKIEDLFKNISATEATEILRPILYAQSTESLRTQFFTALSDAFKTLLNDDTITLTTTNVTLKENEANNQAEEICEVFEKLMAFYPMLSDSTEISSLDKGDLGRLLDSMKKNAYRESETGIFAEVFDKLASATAIIYNIKRDADGTYKSVNFEEVLTSTEAGK